MNVWAFQKPLQSGHRKSLNWHTWKLPESSVLKSDDFGAPKIGCLACTTVISMRLFGAMHEFTESHKESLRLLPDNQLERSEASSR